MNPEKKVLTIIFLLLLLVIFLSFNRIKRSSLNEKYKDCTCRNMNTMSYERFKNSSLFYNLSNSTSKQIPKIIFRTGPFHLCKAPRVVKDNLEKTLTLNTDYAQVYFDDDDCRNFIEEYFPVYLGVYDILIPTAFKADLWRLLVIYKFGGIYNDIGHVYVKPISSILDDNDEIMFVTDIGLAPRTAIHNAFFASYPKHPIIKEMLDFVKQNLDKRIYGENPLSITGPKAWGFILYQKLNTLNPGIYHFDDHPIKLLDYVVYEWNSPTNNIQNLKGEVVLFTKFPNYKKIVYDSTNNTHYSELWHRGKVYLI